MATEKRALKEGFMLAQWRVEPLKGQITAPDGSRRRVAPRAMDLLVCLASRPGDVVARSTLFDEAWSQQARSDEALTHCISELRHALDDHSDSPEFLQTIPRRGYRLIAPVSALTAPSAGPPDNDPKTPAAGFIARQFGDLRKRKVIQTVIGYPVLSWLLVQIVDVLWEYLLQPLGAPVWLVPSFVVLMAIGYPIAVFFSWAVDLTPEGMRLTASNEGASRAGGLAIAGVASLAIAVAALFAYFNAFELPAAVEQVPGNSEITESPVARSIAVLRFSNMSADPAMTYLSDGLTEELIHELTNLETIKVAARTSAWPFSTSELQVTEIADQLGVEKILEGSVRADGDRIRVTAQLIDEKGFHVWSEAYDRRVDDILAIQKDIAEKVVDELDIILTDESEVRLAKEPTMDPSAYHEYLLGRQFLREPPNEESLNTAREHFEKAIELDSQFPLAYAGLCESHLAKYRLSGATEHFEAAELACHRALSLDGGLAEVYTALGNLYRHSGQFDKAEQEFNTALSINPMFEEANYGLGRALQGQGRLAEAEKTLRRSIDLEPSYWGAYMAVGNFLHQHGRYAESLPFYEKVTELAPDSAGGYINLGSSLHWLGDWDGAEAAWRRSLELEPDALAYQNLGTLLYYRHRYAEAIEMHRKAVEAAPSDHRNWGKLAAAQRYVPGQNAASRESYRRAIQLVEEQLAVNPDQAEDLYYLSAYLVNTGDLGGARQAIERSLSLAPEDPDAHYLAAIVEMNSGHDELAMAELEKATSLGYSVKLLQSDPEFETLQAHAEFTALLDKHKN